MPRRCLSLLVCLRLDRLPADLEASRHGRPPPSCAQRPTRRHPRRHWDHTGRPRGTAVQSRFEVSPPVPHPIHKEQDFRLHRCLHGARQWTPARVCPCRPLGKKTARSCDTAGLSRRVWTRGVGEALDAGRSTRFVGARRTRRQRRGKPRSYRAECGQPRSARCLNLLVLLPTGDLYPQTGRGPYARWPTL